MLKLNRRTLALSSAAALAVPAARNTFAQATPQASPVPAVTDMQSRIQEVLTKYGVPGALVSIEDPSTTQLMEVGYATYDMSEPIRHDMHMRIASVTKTFVATVVLQMVDEGLVSLDDTMATVLPDVSIVNADRITIRQLLGMQSGLPFIEMNPAFTDAIVADSTRHYSLEELYSYAEGQEAVFEPGTQTAYNNLNYNVLGDVIEKVTGETWQQNVKTRITDPLDLTYTFEPESADMPEPAAHGYGYLEQELPADPTSPDAMATPAVQATPIVYPEGPLDHTGIYDISAFNPSIAGAAGGLVSTIDNMRIWSRAFGTGALLSPEMFQEQQAMNPMDPSGQIKYGLGMLGVQDLLVGHNGAINGFQSLVAYIPAMDMNMAILTNCHPTIGYGDVGFEILVDLLAW